MKDVQDIAAHKAMVSLPPNSGMHEIIKALEFLKIEAEKTGEEEISEIISATFTICLNAYCTIKRIELEKKICRRL
ncbi:MAG: hypothetical protein PHX61_06925 [Alphaproteobacteria bacterium]|nr:hypothetical protein [Alphaproteobacteria bacterium]